MVSLAPTHLAWEAVPNALLPRRLRPRHNETNIESLLESTLCNKPQR